MANPDHQITKNMYTCRELKGQITGVWVFLFVPIIQFFNDHYGTLLMYLNQIVVLLTSIYQLENSHKSTCLIAVQCLASIYLQLAMCIRLHIYICLHMSIKNIFTAILSLNLIHHKYLLNRSENLEKKTFALKICSSNWSSDYTFLHSL